MKKVADDVRSVTWADVVKKTKKIEEEDPVRVKHTTGEKEGVQ